MELGLILDSRVNFQEHSDNPFKKVNQAIDLMQYFQKILPKPPLITIFESFIRPHLDYRDQVYD